MVKCRLSIEMIQSYLRYSPQVHSILHYGLYGLLFHFPSKIVSPFAVLEMVDWIDLISVFPWASLYFFLRWSLFLHTVNSRLADTPIIRTAAKSPAKINYRRLTKINSRYYGLSLMRTLTRAPHSVRNKGS